MCPIRSPLAALALALALAPAPAFANAAEADSGNHDDAPDSHDDDSTDIVVTGHLPKSLGLLSTAVTLEGDDLVADTRGQLGDMLASLPGVSATSFAPGASRPVLRGLDGDRIRVLVDGIGTIDASSVSADHGVVFDPLTTDHIDVVHGPAVLLYGGQAIGGAINAIDKRIPRSVPDRLGATMVGSYSSVAGERALSGAVEVPLAERLALHLDAGWRKADDLRIGGFANAPALRRDLLADAAQLDALGEEAEAAALTALAGLKDRLPNSAARSTTLGAGLAFIDAGGSLGLSVQRFTTHYGVPLRPGSAGEAQPVSIDLAQTRIDLRGSISLDGFFQSLQLRGAFGDYRHAELEGREIGTVFLSKGYEFRTDLIQQDRGGWTGQSGIQLQYRKLEMIGPEAFAPDNAVDRIGLFTLQSYAFGAGFGVDASARYERTRIKTLQSGFDRSYGLFSGALGLNWKPADGWKIGMNLIHGARAPAPEEMLSNGLHGATQSYEVGDPSFRSEKSRGVEAYVKYDGEGLHLSATGYATRFTRFIAALPTGVEREGLPVFHYAQLPARMRGFEASLIYDALHWNGGTLRLDAAADYTRASLKNAGPVPRIPPFRLRLRTEADMGDLVLNIEGEHFSRQGRVASLEAPVKAFTTFSLGADWHPMGRDGPLTLILAAENLLDSTGRRAASFTRDFVPIPGRDLRLTAKISF